MQFQYGCAALTLGLFTSSMVFAAGEGVGWPLATEDANEAAQRTPATPGPVLHEPTHQRSDYAEMKRSPAFEEVLKKYDAKAYREAGREGRLLLESEPGNTELRFLVANSLAWSGSTGDALTQYDLLRGTEYDSRAMLGAAHVNRWTGRPDRAASAYRAILQKEPDNEEARSGLALANRELRPRSAAILGHADNSNDASRVWTALGHKWRDATGATLFEIKAGRIDEDKDNVRVLQRDISLRYEDMNGWLSPQLEVSAQQSPRSRLFGNLSLKISGTPVYLSAGHVNWGKLAFDPRALRAGLTANQLGGKADFRNILGDVHVAYSAYRVSDRNLVQGMTLRLTPSRQPFGTPHVRSFVGLEARKARFNDPRYWSPEEGHYNAFGGIAADWTNDRWQTYGSIQYGVPLTENSGSSWSTGIGIKRWLGENWAVNLDIWAINTPRNGGYRSESATFWIERLW